MLAGLGTIGVASAGAGLGTTAFYSDRESLEGWYEAGRVDLLLDYRSTYRPWERYDLQNVPEDQRPPVVVGTEGMTYEVGAAPAVRNADGDAISHEDWGAFQTGTDVCVLPVPTDLADEANPDVLGGLTVEDDPGNQFLPGLVDGTRGMFIDLVDIKPYDEGETTFSFHLCGNPSYIYAELLDEDSEGGPLPRSDEDYREGVTDPIEPEREAGELIDDPRFEGGELCDYLYVVIAADPDCDNIIEVDENGATDGESPTAPAAQEVETAAVTAADAFSVTDLTDGSLTAEDLAASLVSTQGGVTIDPASVTYTGNDASAGMFQGGMDPLGIESGIILSSGAAADVAGPNDEDGTTTAFDNPGDSDLDTLSNATTEDATVLEFDFTVPQDANKVYFNYVFGSEEYNEYVDAGYNDVFGFFLNGQNLAVVPDPNDSSETVPAAIDNVNEDVNDQLYNNNDPSEMDDGQMADTEMDGFTVVLDVEGDVVPGEPNTLRLAIADAGDASLDSWVLIEGGSLSTEDPTEIVEPTGDVLYAGSMSGWLEQFGPEFDGRIRIPPVVKADGSGVAGDPDVDAFCFEPGVHCYVMQWFLPCKANDSNGNGFTDLPLVNNPVASGTFDDELRARGYVDENDATIDVNITQTDTCHVGLQFTAEQCRHNTGSDEMA